MITIDREFRELIPPLSSEEYETLEKSIVDEGCRDALILWGDVLIDGHNRYEICKRHGIEFSTVQKEFASRNDVIIWMIKNQLGRRNLPIYEQTRLNLYLKPILSEKAKENQRLSDGRGQKGLPNSANLNRIDAVSEIAKAAGVSRETVQRVEKLEKVAPPEIKERLRRGEISINSAFNQIKKQEKAEEIEKAKAKIAEQTKADPNAPILYIGDSIGYKTNEPVDLLLTDPPYSTDVENISEFANSWLPDALDNVKDTGFAYVFIGAYPNELRAYLNTPTPEHIELEQVLVWTYKNTLGNNPKDRYKLNYQACLFFRGVNAPALDCPLTNEQWAVQEINAPDGRIGDRYHMWQKPMEIAERFVRHSTKQGMTVYDPFACTGTFLLAAAKLGRKAFGFELNPDNAKIAFDRGCVKG